MSMNYVCAYYYDVLIDSLHMIKMDYELETITKKDARNLNKQTIMSFLHTKNIFYFKIEI